MTLKTPEQIADAYLQEALGVTAHGNTSPAPMTWWGVRDQMVAVIEADRAQCDRAADLDHATTILTELGYVWKVWTDGDVREEVMQLRPDVTRRELRTITEDVMYSSTFRDLADCTDQDWSKLTHAVEDAIQNMEAQQ